MFTGLVETTGTILRLERADRGLHLTLRASLESPDLKIGESIAVDGVCLTVVSLQGDAFTVDVSEETVSRSTLGQRRPGDEVNLERALRLGDRLSGHLVSGHADGTGRVAARQRRGESLVVKFEIPPELSRYLIEKGSVAVNGVSLTVNRCEGRQFEVNVVPHTARASTLGNLKVGDRVNVEVDLIGKYVEKFLLQRSGSQSTGGVDHEFLTRHGFL
ncbi:MAG: riboflavin synthase [Deltaproteobacteria bacterium]|jgi:riboflavin synthase|nr:riboflavin synthase [Deltaproteobacteria bacterium]